MDAETIDAARRGDRPAQARLLNALQDVWFRFSLSLLHDSDRAADATQETALRFLKQLGSFRGESQLRTWSLGIALNVAREMRRESQKERIFDDSTTQFATERSSEGLSDEVETEDERRMLRKVLDDLPPRQREAIILRFFEERSTEETASAMGCAPGTVKATLHQALRALRLKVKATT